MSSASDSTSGGAGPSPVADRTGLPEDRVSLREAARTLYTSRHDPDFEVDMTIASSMGGILWIGGGAMCLAMLVMAPPDKAIGAYGWLVAGAILVVTVAVGVWRLRRSSESGFNELFVGSVVALLGIAVLEWLAGGRASPYHQLYALPVIYASAVQPRPRSLIVLGLTAVVMWAPLVYARPGAQLPADIAGQLLLLVMLAVAGRIVFTLLRGQRAGLRTARHRAHQLARRDPLTGLGNRLHLEETLDVEVARARRQGSPLSLIVGDLDGFKAINDSFGHSGGDDCLRHVATALEQASRTEDQCFRWGGDEFVVVLPDTDGHAAADVRRRVCSAVSLACKSPDGGNVRLTCGTAELGPDDTVQSLLASADEVLFEFKHTAPREAMPAREAEG